MNSDLEVRRTAEGKIFARRKDGQPLTFEDKAAARKLSKSAMSFVPAKAKRSTPSRSGISRPVLCRHCYVAMLDIEPGLNRCPSAT